MADFVGASESDLAAAIRQIGSRRGYRYFWFAYADRPADALNLERVWSHRFRPTDNDHVATRSEDYGWRCTIIGCATCALAPSGG